MTLPILNQPEVAMLSTDGVHKRPVVVEVPTARTPSRSTGGRARAHLGPPGLRRRVRRGFPPTVKDTLEERDWEAELA